MYKQDKKIKLKFNVLKSTLSIYKQNYSDISSENRKQQQNNKLNKIQTSYSAYQFNVVLYEQRVRYQSCEFSC